MGDELQLLSGSNLPALLREIPDAPERLYLRGAPLPKDIHYLAVVGSRALTPYGKEALRHLLAGLSGYPIVIVSGLAYGMDTEAHRAALEHDLHTVAVPGSGLDWNVLYPRANVSLARSIIEKGGTLLSEEDPSARSMPYMFPKRNRIMAGMCHATLMVEAQERSGSLITARLTTEYNRELLVVPGSIFSETSKGTHQFLKLGATPVTTPEDILLTLGIEPDSHTSPERVHHNLNEEEKRVCALLETPLPHDELLSSLNMPVQEANILLSLMEIKGIIREELGTVRLA